MSPAQEGEAAAKIVYTKFGEITVDGQVYDKDIVMEDGLLKMRDKGPSREQRAKYNHTPLTPREPIPWNCKTLVIGTGMHERLPIVPEFEEEAARRGVQLVILPTKEAVEYYLKHAAHGVNAVFHITC